MSNKQAAGIAAAAAVVLLAGEATRSTRFEEAFAASALAAAATEATMCVLSPGAAARLDQAGGAAGRASDELPAGDLTPVRMVFDPYPSFNGIALDPVNDLVLLSDTNRKSLLVYRTEAAAAPDVAAPAEPVRRVMGPETGIGFIAGVAVDPERREMMTVNNDVEDRMVVFDYDAHGNVRPKRTLYVPHQAWGVAISRELDQLVFSVQTPNMIVWYRREAKGLEPPVRVVRGPRTGMADPHGVAIDDAHDEVFVANHGNWRPAELITSYTAYDSAEARRRVPEAQAAGDEGGGRFRFGSITVYSTRAAGDVPPQRTIAGPLTQLDWPMGIALDPEHDELVVAGNGNDAVLVFPRTAQGNVAPARVIRGPRTGISSPMAVAVRGDEIWVANFGDHTALVFPRTAHGDVPPTRVLRNAPRGTPTVGMGNPYAVAYDSKREQLLVPN
ncbi:MAG TPA: hypothetical protein VNI83_05525 [Vicinamibacterales bacterium]|nr:hypothetical protein [Vicinamibacterales bacterium]